MPDISMCNGMMGVCPLREDCYRFTAIPNPGWQTYADFEYDFTTSTCDFYEPTRPEGV